MLTGLGAELLETPGLEQDALSLSHLTYRFATITVNFHRLDHPPFPCGLNVLQRPKEIKRVWPQVDVSASYEAVLRFGGARMKPATIVGILLIVVGIIGFAVGGVSFTHEKQDAKIGPIEINHQSTDTFPIPPVLSAVALVGGIALVVVGSRRSA